MESTDLLLLFLIVDQKFQVLLKRGFRIGDSSSLEISDFRNSFLFINFIVGFNNKVYFIGLFDQEQFRIFMAERIQKNDIERSRLNKIEKLLSSIQTRENHTAIKKIQQLVVKVFLEKQNDQSECPYYLDLVDIDIQMNSLAEQLEEIICRSKDERLQLFHHNFNTFASKIFSLQPTTLHKYSTKMKSHLLQEIKRERQKRMKVEVQMMRLIEGVSEQNNHPLEQRNQTKKEKQQKLGSCYQCSIKENTVNQLRENLKKLQNILQKLKKQNLKLESDLKNTEFNLIQHKSVLTKVKQSNALLLNSQNQLTKQNQSLKVDNRLLNQTIQSLKDKIRNSQSESKSSNNERSKLVELQSFIKKLSQQNKQYQRQTEILRIKITNIENQKLKLEERSNFLNAQLQQKQKNMNDWISAMQKRKAETDQNLQDPLSAKMYGTSSTFKPKDTNVLFDNRANKTSSDYYNQEQQNQHLRQKSEVSKQSPIGLNLNSLEKDQMLRMLLLQASSLEQFLMQSLNNINFQ